MMGVEMPLFSAFVSRMPDAKINLAAFSSLVFPLALIIEAPIIMMLAASTALAKDRDSYQKLQRFTNASGLFLTCLHAAIVLSPVFDVLALDVMAMPVETIEPARLGLLVMLPWTWAIAERRFQQGVMIRHEQAGAVVKGTVIRLVANLTTLMIGYLHGGFSGIAVGTCAISVGVLAEAGYARWRVQVVLRDFVYTAAPQKEPLSRSRFIKFYVPLALTPLITLVIQPLGAWSMARMPNDLTSLAAWAPVYGLIFMHRSCGFAFNEVVVTLIDQRGGFKALLRFAVTLALCTSGLLALFALSPLSTYWYVDVMGLPDELPEVAAIATTFGILMPAYAVFQNWYQGRLVHAHRTRHVTEAVALYSCLCAVLLSLGVMYSTSTGIYVTISSFVIAGLAQTGWLAYRARSIS